MNRQRIANIVLYAAAVLLVATGALHLTAFGAINTLAQASADVKPLLPLLWVGVGVDLIATGIIVALVGLENSNGGRYVLFAAAMCPWAAALLQIIYLGFVGPTAMLLLDGGLAIAAASLRESRRRRSQG